MFKSFVDDQSVKEKIRVLVIANSLPGENTTGNPTIIDQMQELKEQGLAIYQVLIRAGKLGSYLRALWFILLLNFQVKKYDLVHAYYGHCGLLARLQIKSPVVVTFLGSDLVGKDINGWHDRLIGRVVSKLIDVSIVMTEEMAQHVPQYNFHVIPFGVNTNIFFPQQQKECRKLLGLPLDEILILFPWNPARKEKRYDIVQAATKILQRHYPIKLIAIFNQPHQVLARYMNACDVIVLASDHEGSPMAIREALACNLPVVSVDVGDVATVIEGVNNCYLTSRDPKDVANKIDQVIQDGRRASGYIKVNSMDIKWAASKVSAIYEQLLSR